MHNSICVSGCEPQTVGVGPASPASPASHASPPPARGPHLVLELARLVVTSREPARRGGGDVSDVATATTPSTSQQSHQDVLKLKLTQMEGRGGELAGVGAGLGVTAETTRAQKTLLDSQLNAHVQALWSERVPMCIEVLLASSCGVCSAGPAPHRHCLLLERWTLAFKHKSGSVRERPMTPQWVLNAVRSQLHFSQISAWLQRAREPQERERERQRRRSRETCNYKKIESNCDEQDLNDEEEPGLAGRLRYRVRAAAADESFGRADTHVFPLADVAPDTYLEVRLESLPRTETVPGVRCACSLPRRRPSLAPAPAPPEELAGRLGDLSLSPRAPPPPPAPTDDRLLTPCSESGKHRCSCDDESDAGRLDDRRARDQAARLRRRARRDSRLRRTEHDEPEPTTSIPILQAARFDRTRALGQYRARAYTHAQHAQHAPPPRTSTVATQTDELGPRCACGNTLEVECESCRSRSEPRASRRREREPSAGASFKKHKPGDEAECGATDERVVKRPKLRVCARGVGARVARVASERDMHELLLRDDDSVFAHMARAPGPAPGPDELVTCQYGTFDKYDSPPDWESPAKESDDDTPRGQVPSARATAGFRHRLDSAASMVFRSRAGLPLTSSPAPLPRGSHFDYDDTICEPRHIRSALFRPVSPPDTWRSPGSSPGSPARASPPPPRPRPRRAPAPTTPPPVTSAPAQQPRKMHAALHMRPPTGLLGSFEESALKGRLEPVATVHGFTAELCASGAFCPPHRRLPVTVFFYALGPTNAPYLGHINLGASGYRVPRSGTIQVSLFNPHGTLVKMFVVLYELTDMPPAARTFLRQRTLYLPADTNNTTPTQHQCRRALRYLIHLRFLTSKTGKLYLHTDIRIIVSRKADLDTAAAHLPARGPRAPAPHAPHAPEPHAREEGDASYELRSFTYAPDNPKYSPR